MLHNYKAHCYNGAVFAAAALARLGYPPLVVNLLPQDAGTTTSTCWPSIGDRGIWGAVAKLNFVGLRFREPIYRTLAGLVDSYFEHYYNLAGEKTLRSYTPPAEPDRLRPPGEWLTRDQNHGRGSPTGSRRCSGQPVCDARDDCRPVADGQALVRSRTARGRSWRDCSPSSPLPPGEEDGSASNPAGKPA